jgi:hypothetical protein
MLGFKGSRVFELWYARAHRILDWEIEAIQTALHSRTKVGRLTLRLNTLTSRLGSARAYRARAALWLAHLCRSSALTIAPWIAEERE